MKIAIIGTGISGLGAAYLLQQQHDITVYEKNNTIGGHSRTVCINDGEHIVPVDTGFIVFNYRNYPHLTRLFELLDVPVSKSDMSFGVSINNGWLEYGTLKKEHIFGQTRNVFRPAFWGMLKDIMVFNRKALHYKDSDLSLGACLDALNMGEWFRRYYLLAMGASIWSTPYEAMLDFPARTFIQFFANHGLLTVNDQPQWYTVTGGSKEYVSRLTSGYQEHIKYQCGVNNITRTNSGVVVHDSQGNSNIYDQVVVACHSDQALAMLEKPTQAEQDILGSITYQPNDMVLHSDTRLMPQRKNTWASWVYLSEEQQDKSAQVSLSYWMNNLQPLNTDKPIIVTLNPGREPDAELVHDRYTFHHPVFDGKAIEAQQKLNTIQGVDNIWYCGAWQRYGFHEDGLLSAVNVAKSLGVTIPWEK